MKKTVMLFLTLSICFAGDNLPAQLENLKDVLQKKYQVYSPEDLTKLKNPSMANQRIASRDMEDIVGEWFVEEENISFLITVGTDQSIVHPFAMMALVEAEGSITATTDAYETSLTYLFNPSLMDGGDDINCDINCEGEYDDYINYGISVSDEYCECCHDEYPLDEICEDYSSRSRSCLNLELYDSECDGWNGAYWYVTDADGDTVDYDIEAMAGGCDEQTEICLDEGDYTFYCVGAGDSSDAEISWILYNEDWEEIASGGAGDMASFYVDEDGDDDGEMYAMVMNMSFMELMMFMFGMDMDSLGVENPTIISIGSSTGDEQIDQVLGVILVDGEFVELMADSATAVAATSIDTIEQTITFTGLALSDSSGNAALTVDGTIGPEMIDFIAGEETEIDFMFDEDMFGEDDEEYFFMIFDNDSTGMEIEVWLEEDYYYGDTYEESDTTYFTWYATIDTLVIMDEDDYYDDSDTIHFGYYMSGDTLFVGAEGDPCMEEGYDSYEDCLEDMEDDFVSFSELEDVESFLFHMERVMLPGSYTAVDIGDGTLPDEFQLYSNYPNPFNPVTTIRFDVGQNTGNNTTLRIYDITGRNVATLLNTQLQTGTYEAQWDARGFASGLYFAELVSGTYRHTQKMILMK